MTNLKKFPSSLDNVDIVEMKQESSLLIMIHCEQFTGYAVGVLEKVFLDAAKKAQYREKNIYWSYKRVSDIGSKKVIQCDYHSQNGYKNFVQFLHANDIKNVIAFDLPFPAPVIPILKKAGVTSIISYWGASMSSINKGFKLQLKRLEWMLRSSKPDYFIFESEAMRLSATHGRGVPHNRTHVVPLGVDTTVFTAKYNNDDYAYRVLDIPTSRKIIFYSGHMEERKGVRVIIQAAIQLVDVMKNEDIHFVLCGNKGNEAAVYQQLLENTEANSHVTFAGYRTDIAALMRSSYIGVIASTGWDSFTMSSVEMMSSGLPMIVSNLQGLAETIENNVNGFHIEPGNYRELAEKISYICSNADRALEFSKASNARAVSLFSREQQIKNIASILSNA